MNTRDIVVEILFRRILAADATGFSLLRKLPSTHVVRYLKYVSALDADTRTAFHRANAFRAARYFGYRTDDLTDRDFLAPFERYRHHLNSTSDWDATDYRSLRMMRPILAQDPSASLHQTLPPSLKARVATIETAKAKDLRKVAKLAFAQLLGAKPANTCGVWIYSGNLEGENVEVEIDYGSMLAQLRYDVRLPRFWRQRLGGPNYESLLGAGLGWWDQIEQGQEDAAFAALVDAVRQAVEICREVYASGHALEA